MLSTQVTTHPHTISPWRLDRMTCCRVLLPRSYISDSDSCPSALNSSAINHRRFERVNSNNGEERKLDNGLENFLLECYNVYLYSKLFGETSIKLTLSKFCVIKRINLLKASPLKYYPKKILVMVNLLKLISLIDVYRY